MFPLLIFPLLLLLLYTGTGQCDQLSPRPRPIIIDTDIFSDVDDVGSLAIANVLHNCGLAELRGVMINTPSEYGALTVNTINTYYGNGAIPIGALRPFTSDIYTDTYLFTTSDYASKLPHHFPHTLPAANKTPTPLDLYTTLLESTPDDHPLTIISLGFLTNLAALLASPRTAALLPRKVRELVLMGGQYPSGWEFNFGGSDPAATARVLAHWPRSVPVTYSGAELGAGVLSGARLAEASVPRESPVRAAYEWYVGRGATRRESWDPITTLYGILGLGGFESLGIRELFAFANAGGGGYNSITHPNGSNAWVEDPGVVNQHWLRLADGVGNESVAWVLDRFYTHDPVDKTCFR